MALRYVAPGMVRPTVSPTDEARYSAIETDCFLIFLMLSDFMVEVFVSIAIQPLEEAGHTNV
jgi:hypothetical protein